MRTPLLEIPLGLTLGPVPSLALSLPLSLAVNLTLELAVNLILTLALTLAVAVERRTPTLLTADTNAGLPIPPTVTRVVPRRDLPPEHFAFAFVGSFLTCILARNIGPSLRLRNRLTNLKEILTPPPRSYLTSPDPKPILPWDTPLRLTQWPTTCRLTNRP